MLDFAFTVLLCVLLWCGGIYLIDKLTEGR